MNVSRLLNPMKKSEVRVALATIVVAYAAEYGLGLSEGLVQTILALGIAALTGMSYTKKSASIPRENAPVITRPPQ